MLRSSSSSPWGVLQEPWMGSRSLDPWEGPSSTGSFLVTVRWGRPPTKVENILSHRDDRRKERRGVHQWRWIHGHRRSRRPPRKEPIERKAQTCVGRVGTRLAVGLRASTLIRGAHPMGWEGTLPRGERWNVHATQGVDAFRARSTRDSRGIGLDEPVETPTDAQGRVSYVGCGNLVALRSLHSSSPWCLGRVVFV
eukprot:scaffold867_cov317-Pavlova_lutheri.AAC.4